MIILTRLGGQQLALNPDLIERAEPTPDTVITMVDGHKLVVVESVPVVIDRIRTWRASISAEADVLSRFICLESPDDVPDASETPPISAPPAPRRETTEEIATHGALGASLARVLRLPARED